MMQTAEENSNPIPYTEREILNKIKLKMEHLFSMKERERLVLGDFINSEVLSFNKPAESVKKYELTYQLDLIGSMQGKVMLNLDNSLAQSVAGTLFGSSGTVSEEDTDTAMQELLNIFAGHMATAFNELGIDLDIATPEKSNEDFLSAKDGRRILFRFACLGNIIQFILILKP